MNASVKTINLSEVAEVLLGQTFRGKAESSAQEGQVRLIQIKNLFKGIIKQTADLPFAATDNPKVGAILKPNDILIPVRGGRLAATLYQPSEANSLVIATNQVAIIRVTPNIKVTQDYLLWFLNSEYGAHLLSQLVKGSTILSINKNDLLSLKVDLPDEQTQHKVGQLYLNWLEQEQTLKAMINNGTKLTEKYCAQLVEAGKNNG